MDMRQSCRDSLRNTGFEALRPTLRGLLQRSNLVPSGFVDHARPVWWLVGGAVFVTLVALLLRRRNVSLLLIALTIAGMALSFHGQLSFGPPALALPQLNAQVFATAAIALVFPQLPLTFANSCLATADVARTYFGARAERVKPGRLALNLGVAKLVAGAICGMPVCHGAGGMTAHRSFGASAPALPIILSM